jgi:tetratricopeptide (TPR) repeat protein
VLQKQTLFEGLRALPGDESLFRTLGALLDREADWSELRRLALEQLPHLPRGSRLEAQAAYLGGKACLELGDLRQALSLITRALRLQDDFAYSHHIHGRVLARMGRRVEAILAQERCAALAPGFPWCWFELGQLQLEIDQTAAGREALQRALHLAEVQDPGGPSQGLFRRALAGVENRARLEERRAAARHLWPDRSELGPQERLRAIDELALSVEQFSRFLDRIAPDGSG